MRKQTEARYEQAFRFLEEQNCLFSGLRIKAVEDANSLRLAGTDRATERLAFKLQMTFKNGKVKEINFQRHTESIGSYPVAKVLAQTLQKAPHLWDTPTREVNIWLRVPGSKPPGEFSMGLSLSDQEIDTGAGFLADKEGTIYYMSGPR
ncbi:MAG: hypothetical protein KF784_15735 [Fimbriimonadaceae bacterium]|nr:hypothetical protein [Fimbriimonadaceae bacterium]